MSEIKEHNLNLIINAFNLTTCRDSYFLDQYTKNSEIFFKLLNDNGIIEYFDYLSHLKLFKVCSFVYGISYKSTLEILRDTNVENYDKIITVLKANMPPNCNKCNEQMVFGIAIDAMPDGFRVAPISKIVDLNLIDCWKCPICGNSEEIELKLAR